MEKKLYVECRISKGGKPYVGLICDLGYRKVLITVDRFLISEILGITVADLYSMSVGEYYELATLHKSK